MLHDVHCLQSLQKLLQSIRFELNWSSNLNKHFDFDLYVSVLDSFCMHLPSFPLQIALGHSTSRT